MTSPLKPHAEQALQQRSLKYFHDQGDTRLLVPFRLENGKRLEVHIILDDEREEAYLLADIFPLSSTRIDIAARLLLDLNRRSTFVKFTLLDDAIVIEADVELATTTNPAALIGLGFDRLMQAYLHSQHTIEDALSTTSKAVFEAQSVLDSLDF